MSNFITQVPLMRCCSLLQAILGAYRNHREITHHPSWFLLRTSNSKQLNK